MLPGIDDGAPDMETALAMARIAVEDGITVTACTPHITPGIYDNDGPGIAAAIGGLQHRLDAEGIAMRLVRGADAHLAPDLAQGLASGRVPSLNGSRYFLFEPPHHVAPPQMASYCLELLDLGHTPLVTHPERLSWIEGHYEMMQRMAAAGAWMQITAGSLTGRFGRRPRYWAERMLDDGIVHVLATDAHNLGNRAPRLAEGRDAAAERIGEDEATHLVLTRPQGILDDRPPGELPPCPGDAKKPRSGGFMRRFFKSSRS